MFGIVFFVSERCRLWFASILGLLACLGTFRPEKPPYGEILSRHKSAVIIKEIVIFSGDKKMSQIDNICGTTVYWFYGP